MGCGCGGAPANAITLTSGDVVAEPVPVAADAAAFKVLPGDDGDPVYFDTYRAARIHQAAHGGTLRAT